MYFWDLLYIRNEKSGNKARGRIMMSKDAMKRLDKIPRDKDISLLAKKKMIESMIFPIASFGNESWTDVFAKAKLCLRRSKN